MGDGIEVAFAEWARPEPAARLRGASARHAYEGSKRFPEGYWGRRVGNGPSEARDAPGLHPPLHGALVHDRVSVGSPVCADDRGGSGQEHDADPQTGRLL